MQIEEAKDILLNVIANEVIGTYCIEIQKEVNCSKNCENEDCYLIQAIDTVLNELKEQTEANKELNKVIITYKAMINEMAEYISNLDIEEDICMKNTKRPDLCNERYSKCRECIKEYFYKKVEDKKYGI